MRKIPHVSILIVALAACSANENQTSFSKQIENPKVQTWIGASKTDLLRSWGEPASSTQTELGERVLYIFHDFEEALEDYERNEEKYDINRNAIPPDILNLGIEPSSFKFISEAFKTTCFVTFELDQTEKVYSARVSTFSEEITCEKAAPKFPMNLTMTPNE